MSEPIILDGGARMVTIKLPAYFQKDEKEGAQFNVSPESENAPFRLIVITDTETGSEMFNWPLDDRTQWKIEIK
jgi:hypothetical protein